MRRLQQGLSIIVLAVMLFSGAHNSAFAQTQTADLLAQINALRAQIAQLQAQIAGTLNKGESTPAIPFLQPLRPGMQNEEVRRLQAFLATLPGIYPEAITSGFYGQLTTAAVRRFQARYGIDAIGIVGPQTRAQLNALRAVEPEETSEIEEALTPPPTLVADESERIERGAITAEGSLDLPNYNIFALAQDVQDAINIERENRGLRVLEWNETLALISRLHSEDQAQDNIIITDETRPCSYPLLRHEGKTRGITVLERTRPLVSNLRRVGENIVTFPANKSSAYTVAINEEGVECPDIEALDFEDFDGSEERLAAFNTAVQEREEALEEIPQVTFIRREWRDEEEIIEKAVDLWLGSPGHRENLLRPDYTEAGVGIAVVNNYYIITQVFTERR